MNRAKGFTLIELLITMAIIGIIASMVAGHVDGTPWFSKRDTTICKGGFLWNVDLEYNQRQVLNENGGGVRCQ